MQFVFPRPICLEEEQDFEHRPGAGFPQVPIARIVSKEIAGEEEGGESSNSAPPGISVNDFLSQLMAERAAVLANEKLTTGEKVKLLETSRYPLAVASGRGVTFKTEEVVRWMLLYSMAVVVVLALLTAWGKLSAEVTMSFVGTVVGGLIATVAQKLGRI